MQVTVPVFQRKRGGLTEWITLGLGPFSRTRRGAQTAKLHQQLVDDLRHAIETAKPADLVAFDLKKGTTLRRVRIEIAISDAPREKKKKVSGMIPLIVEPRPVSPERNLEIGYHPDRQDEWFPVDPLAPLEDQAIAWFARAWAELSESTVEDLWTDGKDLIRALAFSAQPQSLLDQIAGKRKGLWDDLENDPAQKSKPRRAGMKVLPNLGVDRTARRSALEQPAGAPRSPYREQLQMLLAGPNKRSTLVVGPPGVGKTTLIDVFLEDLLIFEDFPSHRNLDKVTHVWEIFGKRIIAGMSFVGDWEQRVTDLIEDARGRKIILYVPDLHAFGRIGQARDSSRAIADVMRGPVARGEITVIGEATEEQLARFEQDAPTFASLFARVHLPEASAEQTFRMLLTAARNLEAERAIAFEPMALRTLLELGSALLAQRALPGKALELLRNVADEASARGAGLQWIHPNNIMQHLSTRTGMPQALLDASKPLLAHDVERDLSARVIGQEAAVRSASELVLRIRAGLTDPRRPYGVYLFTGPTGTGKTELAKAIAKYLYGSEERLLRFDMGELAGPDAPSRLIGDRWDPEGLLTRAVHEQPFCVVLFDEIEKAHPSVLNLFLQLFDEGRLTDAAGQTASFKHAVIIMTSNLGARREAKVGFGEDPRGVMQDIAKAVRDFFPPELFNRIDEIVPFSPLTHDVAIEVAQKELGKLLARRGVTARHIFVQANRAVVERVAAEAFQQRDGARSLKRFLEDRIGSLIGEEIAKSPAAMLRVLHLFAQKTNAPFRVEQEALTEATAIDLRSALEPLLDRPAEELIAHVQGLLPELEAIEQSKELAALADRIREALRSLQRGERDEADAVFRLDGLRGLVHSLHDRVESLLVTSRELDHEAIERKQFSHEVFETGAKFAWQRKRLRVLAGGQDAPDPRTRSSRALLGTIAEAAFLRHALSAADDATRHGVALELVPLGAGVPHSRLLQPLMDAYLGVLAPPGAHRRGDLDGWAIVGEDGVIEEGTVQSALTASVARRLTTPGRAPVQIVIRAVGLCLLDLFGDETGTHMLHDTLQAPALVRVRALPVSPATTARGLAEEYAAARAAWARSVAEDGAPLLSANKLLPIVRSITRDPRTAGPSAHTIEDYRIAYVDTVWARTFAESLQPIWLLKLSSRGPSRASGGSS